MMIESTREVTNGGNEQSASSRIGKERQDDIMRHGDIAFAGEPRK